MKKTFVLLLFLITGSAFSATTKWAYDGFAAPKSIPYSSAVSIIRESFAAWNGCGVRFTEQPTGAEHDFRKDGTYRVLFTWGSMANEAGKTTFLPVDETGLTTIIVSFDTKENNTPAKFRNVAVHEIGHVLGLPHSVSNLSVMNSAPGNPVKTPTRADMDWCREMTIHQKN